MRQTRSRCAPLIGALALSRVQVFEQERVRVIKQRIDREKLRVANLVAQEFLPN